MGADGKQEALRRVAASIDVECAFSALPHTFLQILNTPPESEGAFERYLSFLKREPGLAAKALRVANTSFFAGRKSVDNLQTALVRLGTASTRNIILSVGIMQLLDGQRGLLRHTLACAALSARLAREAELDNGDTYFTAGMLHDLGKLLLWESPQGRTQSPSEPVTRGDVGLERERWLYGADHAEIGGWFAREWGLPDSLIEVLETHHRITPESSVLAQVVAQANRWTAQYYDMNLHDAPPCETFFDWAQAALGLSRTRMREALVALAEDMEALTAHLDAPTVSMGDVVRMLTEANLRLGSAAVETEGLQRRTASQVQQLHLLQECSSVLGACVGRKTLCEMAISLIVERLGYRTVSVMAPNSSGRLYVQACIGLPADIAGNPGADSEGPISRMVYDSGKALLVRDIRREKDFAPSQHTSRYANHSLLSVPLCHGDSVFGVLNLNNKADNSAFDSDDQQFFELFARMLGSLLHAEQERQRRESSDQRFRLLAASAPLALVGFDMHGTVWLWNNGAYRLTGIPPHAALGHRVPGAILPRGAEEVLNDWLRACGQGRSVMHEQADIPRADGSNGRISYSLFPLEENSLVVWSAVDITAEHRAQLNAEKRAVEIEATRRALENILDELDEDRMLSACVQNAVRAVGVSRGLLLLREAGDVRMTCRGHTGFDVEEVTFVTEWVPGLSELLRKAIDDEKAVINNLAVAPGGPGRSIVETSRVRSIAAVPLRLGKQAKGVLAVFDKSSGPFNAADLRVLYDMANVTSLAFHVAREHAAGLRYEQMRTMAGMATTYNHNINNALQAIQGAIDYVRVGNGASIESALREIEDAASRIAEVNLRMGRSFAPTFRAYPGGGNLIDLRAVD